MVDNPNILISIISAISFYLIPMLIGLAIINLAQTIFKKNMDKTIFSYISKFFLSFMTGALAIYGLALLVNNIKEPNVSFTTTFPKFLIILLTISILINLVFVLKSLLQRKPSENSITAKKETWMKRVPIYIAILIISLTTYGIWKYGSSYKTTLNWDIYHQQTLAYSIIGGEFDYSPSKLSDSFQFEGYSTMFHLLLATPQILFKPEVLSFWWFIEFFHLVTVGMVSYMLGYAVSRRKAVGLLSTLLGAFFFEAQGSYTNLFLIPQNLAAVVTVAAIAMVIDHLSKQDELTDNPSIRTKPSTFLNDAAILVFIGYVTLNHYILGLLGIFLVFVTLVFLLVHGSAKFQKYEKALVILSLVVLVTFPILTSALDLDFVNRGEAAYYKPTLSEKFEFAKDTYGFSAFLFLPLGIYYLLRQKESQNKLFAVLLFGNLALFLAPLPYIMKLYSIGRFFVYTTMALGFWIIIKNQNKFVKSVSLALLTLTLIIIFTTNVVRYKQVPTYKDIYTHVSPNELEAAKFLKQNYNGKNVLLISEPATMHVLEGLSGVNSPGGAYTENKTRQILNQIYYIRDSQKMLSDISEIRDSLDPQKPEIILLAVDGRFSKWEESSNERKYGIHWNVWTPYDLNINELESYSFIDFAEKHANFRVVYKNDGIVILEATGISTGI